MVFCRPLDRFPNTIPAIKSFSRHLCLIMCTINCSFCCSWLTSPLNSPIPSSTIFFYLFSVPLTLNNLLYAHISNECILAQSFFFIVQHSSAYVAITGHISPFLPSLAEGRTVVILRRILRIRIKEFLHKNLLRLLYSSCLFILCNKICGKPFPFPWSYELITQNTFQNNACFTIFGQFHNGGSKKTNANPNPNPHPTKNHNTRPGLGLGFALVRNFMGRVFRKFYCIIWKGMMNKVI